MALPADGDLVLGGGRYTSLFIGSIPSSVSDATLESILRCCGSLRRWKRIVEPNGSKKAFGFAEFDTAEGILRALRLIPVLQLGDRQLTIKTDDSTATFLQRYERLAREKANREKRRLELEQDKRAIHEIACIIDPSAKTSFQGAFQLGESTQKKRPRESSLERDAAFRERERRWMAREQSVHHDLQRELEKDEDRRRRRMLETERLERFLASYDDATASDDFHRNRAKWRERRAAERQKEEDADAEDRSQQQIEEQQCNEENDAIAVYMQEMQKESENISQQEPTDSQALEQISIPPVRVAPIKRSLLTNGHSSAGVVAPAFSEDSPQVKEDQVRAKKAPPLIELTREELRGTGMRSADIEETIRGYKTERLRRMMDSIPTEPSEVFAYSIEWRFVSESLLQKKLLPFAMKKICESLGFAEPSLAEYVIDHLRQQSDALSIVKGLSTALEQESEGIVLKVWKFLIFESESEKIEQMFS